MGRRGKARRGEARRGEARRGEVRRGETAVARPFSVLFAGLSWISEMCKREASKKNHHIEHNVKQLLAMIIRLVHDTYFRHLMARKSFARNRMLKKREAGQGEARRGEARRGEAKRGEARRSEAKREGVSSIARPGRT